MFDIQILTPIRPETGQAHIIPIGYSVLNLFDDQGTLVIDGPHALAVHTNTIDDHYLRNNSSPSLIKFILLAKQKTIVHMQDHNATLFLHTCDQITKLLDQDVLDRDTVKKIDEKRTLLSGLQRASHVVTIPQTSLFIHVMTSLMGQVERHREQYDEVRDLCSDLWSAFLFLLRNIASVTGDTLRTGILSVYVHHLFDQGHNKTPWYKSFLAQWNQFLRRVQFDNHVKNYDPSSILNDNNIQSSPSLSNIFETTVKRSPSDVLFLRKTHEVYRLTAVDSLRFSWLCYAMLLKSLCLQCASDSLGMLCTYFSFDS
jgi:hypothetical protein